MLKDIFFEFSTIRPRSLVHFDKAANCIKMDKTSWPYSKTFLKLK